MMPEWISKYIIAPLIVIAICALGGNLVMTGKLYYQVQQMQQNMPSAQLIGKVNILEYRINQLEKELEREK